LSFIVVIPSRYQSSRLPGKPLADICGKPMVQWVYERASLSGADQVVIATDDNRIKQAAESFGAKVVMTSADHPSGTDRLAEVTDILELADDAVVVNVQGDEPLIPPQVIDQVASNLIAHPDCAAATLSHAIESPSEFKDPSAVKVVSDHKGSALYFSRAPIPWPRDLKLEGDSLPNGFSPQRHLGIYAYRVNLLRSFVTWPKAPLEELESLEQLRILHQGQKIHVEQSSVSVPAGVDNPEDLDRVRALVQA
jgi:3-deoxy-manno-octulosonate cytidylyltransferase (CMP-KDO synthetase)